MSILKRNHTKCNQHIFPNSRQQALTELTSFTDTGGINGELTNVDTRFSRNLLNKQEPPK